MITMKNVARFISCFVGNVLVGLIVITVPIATHAVAFQFDTGGGDGYLSDEYPSFTIVGNSWGKHADGEIGTYTTYSTTFSRHGTLVFDWIYTSSDENMGDYEDVFFDPAGYKLNGTYYDLPYNVYNDDPYEFIGVIASGSMNLSIESGDKFSWWVLSTDDCCGAATLQVSAQYAVPEPGTLALLGLGISGLVFVRRRM